MTYKWLLRLLCETLLVLHTRNFVSLGEGIIFEDVVQIGWFLEKWVNRKLLGVINKAYIDLTLFQEWRKIVTIIFIPLQPASCGRLSILSAITKMICKGHNRVSTSPVFFKDLERLDEI